MRSVELLVYSRVKIKRFLCERRRRNCENKLGSNVGQVRNGYSDATKSSQWKKLYISSVHTFDVHITCYKILRETRAGKYLGNKLLQKIVMFRMGCIIAFLSRAKVSHARNASLYPLDVLLYYFLSYAERVSRH